MDRLVGGSDYSQTPSELADSFDGDGQSDETEPLGGPPAGVAVDDLEAGDEIRYYIDRPESVVYGQLAEGIVEKAPPWERGASWRGETVEDKAVVDVSDHTTDIPLAWIVDESH